MYHREMSESILYKKKYSSSQCLINNTILDNVHPKLANEEKIESGV